MEIERKFTIKSLPNNLEQYKKREIEQGYLCTDPVIRIRKSDQSYILTYKSPYMGKDGSNEVRMCNELEAGLDEKAYMHLKEKIDHNLICKSRYLIPYNGGYLIELDVFHGKLEGLVFAEVEFSSKEDAESFLVPEWFDQDVSTDGRYNNHYLSTLEQWRN